MTGERIIPGGAALEAFHTLGSDNWNTDMDSNLRKIAAGLTSALVVRSQTTVLPGTPTLGDIYIVKDGETNAKQVAVWDGPAGSEVWTYYPAFEGLEAYPLDTKDGVIFDGTNWVPAGGGARKLLTVGLATPLSIPSSANTVPVFDKEVRDTENVFAVGVNPSRLPALGNGPHRVSAHIEWDGNTSQMVLQHIFTLNRAGSSAWNIDFSDLIFEGISYTTGLALSRHIFWSGIADLVSTDYMEMVLWQSTGVARDLGVHTHITLEFLG